jgi:hypothetical protein
MLFVAMTSSTVQAFRFLAGLAIRYNQAQINQESSSRPLKEPVLELNHPDSVDWEAWI